MREILFRGKNIDTGEWVYGGYAPYPHARFPCKPTIYEVSRGCWHPVEIVPETLGQYTGLTDKNGKRIFEGDIIKIPDDYSEYGRNAGEKYEVIFGHGGFRLKPKYRKNAKGYWLEDDGVVEVIGNIHDNPELMEET